MRTRAIRLFPSLPPTIRSTPRCSASRRIVGATSPWARTFVAATPEARARSTAPSSIAPTAAPRGRGGPPPSPLGPPAPPPAEPALQRRDLLPHPLLRVEGHRLVEVLRR